MKVNKFGSRLFVVLLILTLLLSSFSASGVGVFKETGDVPYDTFVYWEEANTAHAVRAKGMFDFDTYLTSEDLIEGGVMSLSDICFDKNDNMYLLDGVAGKIYIYDKEFNYLRTVESFVDENGEVYDYAEASGMFVSSRDYIYICDTEHARLLIANPDGTLRKALYLPDSSLIPDNLKTNYRPTAVTVDSSEYIYVLSEGSYYGAMLYAPEGNFLGFYGANTVETSILGFLSSIWENLTMTDAKKASAERKLPFQFTDLYIDSSDFVYTATASTQWGVNKGQIKRMSPGGLNTLSNEVTFGLRYGVSSLDRATFSGMADVAVNEDNYIFTFDTNIGGIYVYNDDCVLLNAFGGGSTGKAEQVGVPDSYTALDVNSEDTIALIDSGKLSVSIFKINEYGKTVLAADLATRNGDYEAARPLWEEVLRNDRNSQVAYSGIARTYFASGDYDKAMEYAEYAFNVDVYSSAFEYVRRDYLAKNINWIALVIVLVVVAYFVVRHYLKKHNIVLIKNVELKLLSRVTLHPGDVFAEVKLHNRGSVLIGSILIALYYVTAIVKETASGFLFRSHVASAFNSLMVLVQTLGVVLMWTVCNWAVCTLLNGKGKIKEIFIVTSYSLVPLIISNIVYTVASNYLIAGEAAFLSIFTTIMSMLTAFILIAGMIKIHDYTFGEFLWTSILSALGILIVIFLAIAVFILVQQTYSFILTIAREIILR